MLCIHVKIKNTEPDVKSLHHEHLITKEVSTGVVPQQVTA